MGPTQMPLENTPLEDSFKSWKFFNSHLFWLNSHPFFASWSRNTADLQALRTRQARPGCEFNQKRYEFNFFFNNSASRMNETDLNSSSSKPILASNFHEDTQDNLLDGWMGV